jgi:multicomponent K+:H+ antiporter subunit A
LPTWAGFAVDDLWLWAMAVPWIGVAVLAAIPHRWDRRSNDVAVVFSVITAGLLTWALALPGSSSMRDIMRVAWVPEIGLELHVVRDGLADLFGVLVVWISGLVLVFARHYLPEANRHERADRRQSAFYALMLAFTGSMLLTISSGNSLQMFFGWELTGVISYLLIAYWRHVDEARAGAWRTFGLTTAGGLALVAGLVWLGASTGTWSVGEWLTMGPLAGPTAEICASLIILGALAKSAQFPFSNWLPQAMLAPTPVSAFLHSSALVALGVFALARTFPLFHATVAWRWLLLTAGVVGVVVGGVLAARQSKLKSLLAWSTVSMYAFMVIGFSLGTPTGLFAALYAFFVHAIIKAGLFLIAGSVTYLTGKKELDQIGGVGKHHPIFAVCGIVLGLSLGGVPLTGGFYFKEELLHAAASERAWLLFGALLVGGGLSIIYMLRFLHAIFVGPGGRSEHTIYPRTMGLPIVFVSFLAVLTGFLPNWMAPLGLEASLAEISPRETFPVSVELNPLFFTSITIVAMGGALWFLWHKRWIPRQWWVRLPEALPLGGHLVVALYGTLASRCVRVHTGSLRSYIRRHLVALLVLSAVALLVAGPSLLEITPDEDPPATGPLLAVVGVVVLAAVGNVSSRSYLAFALTLTLLGFSLGAVFLLLHAPDVALAQVLVEMLATLSVLLAVRHSGRIEPLRSRMRGDESSPAFTVRALIALALGTAAALGTWLATARPHSDSVGDWYAANISTQTGASDHVAAILTDLRGLDTLGEVLVFAIAVLAVRSLYQGERRTP